MFCNTILSLASPPMLTAALKMECGHSRQQRLWKTLFRIEALPSNPSFPFIFSKGGVKYPPVIL